MKLVLVGKDGSGGSVALAVAVMLVVVRKEDAQVETASAMA